MKESFLVICFLLQSMYVNAAESPNLIGCIGLTQFNNLRGFADVELKLEKASSMDGKESYKLFGTLGKSNTLFDLIVNESDLSCKFSEVSWFNTIETDKDYLFSCQNKSKGLQIDLIRIETASSVYFQLRRKENGTSESKALVNFSHAPKSCLRQ